MKLHLLCENLQKKLPYVTKIVSSKNQLPVLSNVLLKTKNGKLQIKGTDLEIGIQIEVPANIEEEGAVTVPAKAFSDLINAFSEEKITLQTKGNLFEVTTKKTKSTFQTLPEEEFPKLYEEKGEKIMSIKKDFLEKKLPSVIFAASQDLNRPNLSGILIKKGVKDLTMVATDGYRLSLRDLEVELLKNEDQEVISMLLIPARVFKEAIFLKDQEGEVEVYIFKKNNQILFKQDGTILVGRLIDAEYPSYEKIIPSGFSTTMLVDKEEIQKAVKICSVFARETANIIRFSLKNDLLIVSANTPSVGDNKVEVSAKITGDESEIAFNAKYLLDLFANIQTEELIFETSGPLTAGVFKIKEDPSFLHLIMPIRVQE
ncbi:MAG: DNA polymerase III subunit beta [bacterium]|nr:DNA polymerase III subunit beta [bacterium]